MLSPLSCLRWSSFCPRQSRIVFRGRISTPVALLQPDTHGLLVQVAMKPEVFLVLGRFLRL